MSSPLLKGGSILLFPLLWQLISLWAHTPLLPPPIDVVENLFSVNGKELWGNLAISLARIGGSGLLALLLSLTLSFWGEKNNSFRKGLKLFLNFFSPLPKIALIPPLLLLFGTGELSKIILLTTTLFFPLAISIREGLESIDKNYYLSFHSLGGDYNQKLIYLLLPSLSPPLFSALRVSTAIAAALLFFCENFGTTKGIGYYIMDASVRLDFPALYGGIMVLSLSLLIFYMFLDRLEQWLCPWLKICKKENVSHRN